MSNIAHIPSQQPDLLSTMASRANLDPMVFKQTLMATVMPAKTPITDEQFTAFLMVAQKYNLNPITKEIYAFPTRGGIQPIIPIDGWLKIINGHPKFDGMEFHDQIDQGKLVAVTCKIFRKDRSHSTEVTEYMSECSRNTDTWNKWPARMLRHKATIQAARYAFSLSGIYDEDEAERIAEAQEAQVISNPLKQINAYPEEDFEKNLPKWLSAIESNKKTADEIINIVSTKGELNGEQKARIKGES